MRLVIKNGRVVDPSQGIDEKFDVYIKDGTIQKVSKRIRPNKARVIDAKGLVVSPGFVDMHVHLREPGNEEKETIATGTLSAARGGYASVVPMANTLPPIDCAGMVQFIKQRAEETAAVRVWPVASVTKGLRGEQLTEIAELVDAGIVALSDDGKSIPSSQIMRRALEYSRMFGIPIIDHAEDAVLSEGGVMNEGLTSTVLGLIGIPKAAEEIVVARDLTLAEMTEGRLHVAHVSTARSVSFIREARRRGADVTCETAPHYFCLTDEAVTSFDPNAKMNPPLREKPDIEAIKRGLKDGVIDVIATDHAPHTPCEKDTDFASAPFGIVGLETALPLILTELVHTERLTLSDAIAKITANPAGILGLPVGTLEVGAPADVTIFDPEAEVTVDPSQFASRGRNTPFAGRTLKGRVEYTIVAGKIVYQHS